MRDYFNPTGLELLDGVLAGDREAWPVFVRRYANRIYAAIHAVTSVPKDEVEDVFQDVFVRLCKHDFALLRRYDRKKAKLGTYLVVIARSCAIDHGRRSREHAPIEDASHVPAPPTVVRRPIRIPAQVLTGRQCLILSLLYDQDLDPADIADRLGVTAQTVRSAHHKALERLRKHYQEKDDQ